MKIIALAICVCAFAASGEDMTRAIGFTKGALAKTCLRIVDQDGLPVEGARIYGGFTLGGRDKYVLVDGVTNTNGEYIAEGKCNDWLHYSITKDGYYMSSGDVKYLDTKSVPAVVADKWQPYGETRTVVLKKIKNPIRLRDPGSRYRYKYPESGKWAGFDLVCGDWVPPLGNGKYEDVMIRYIREQRQDGYFKSLDISFTNNPYAGAYLMNKDSFSEMDSVYEADTNGVYVGCLRYEFERTAKGNHTISELGPGQYLVFRIRAKTDDEGNLVSAHYGRIMGALQYLEKGGMVLGPVYFNPTPNDTNLEDGEAHRKSLLRKKQALEFERRRKAVD